MPRESPVSAHRLPLTLFLTQPSSPFTQLQFLLTQLQFLLTQSQFPLTSP